MSDDKQTLTRPQGRPDRWHDSGEMALVRPLLDSMVDVEPYRDSAPALDDLLLEYLAEGGGAP